MLNPTLEAGSTVSVETRFEQILSTADRTETVGTERYNTKLIYEANHNLVELNARPVLKCQHGDVCP